MSFGAHITNGAGNVIIDGTYKNYGISGTYTVDMAATGGRLYYSQINGATPMVYVRSSTANGFIGIFEMTTTYIQFGAVNSSNVVIWPVITVMLAFPSIPSTDGSTVGMIVYDAGGVKTYDSRWNVPRVGSILFSGSFGTAIPAAGNITTLYHGLNVNNAWFCLNMSAAPRLIDIYIPGGCGGGQTTTFYGFLTGTADANNIQFKKGTLKFVASGLIVHTPPYDAPYTTNVLYNT